MELFQSLIACALDLFQIDFILWGVTFSFWEVFLYTGIAGVLVWFIGEVFLDD